VVRVVVIVVRIAIVRISMVLVDGGMVLMSNLTFPLVTCPRGQGLVWPLVQGSIWLLVLGSIWPLARVLTQALRRLPPTHGIYDESHLYQRSADPAGKSGKCRDESVDESPSLRILRMPLSAPTKIFPLTTGTSESSESVRQKVISELS
jgi:hypothetical protein